uniref:Uncharacterized protein n=1 Tax=Anguilla anguilla TaxID=7936 RepID=A0A0E9W713_ANGAN
MMMLQTLLGSSLVLHVNVLILPEEDPSEARMMESSHRAKLN